MCVSSERPPILFSGHHPPAPRPTNAYPHACPPACLLLLPLLQDFEEQLEKAQQQQQQQQQKQQQKQQKQEQREDQEQEQAPGDGQEQEGEEGGEGQQEMVCRPLVVAITFPPAPPLQPATRMHAPAPAHTDTQPSPSWQCSFSLPHA